MNQAVFKQSEVQARMQACAIGLVLLLANTMAACTSATAGGASVQGVPPAQPIVTTNAAAIAKARADSTRYPYTEADVHFMSAMIGHHAQAVQMARLAATHGASAPVQRLAARIITGQQDEIALLQQWLADRQKRIPDPHAAEHDMHMPGMLTRTQLQQLYQARGAEFDRLFLTFMIQHHRGALSMVQQLVATHGAAQDQTVFKFASDVNVDQTTEIARMEQMLGDLAPNQRN